MPAELVGNVKKDWKQLNIRWTGEGSILNQGYEILYHNII